MTEPKTIQITFVDPDGTEKPGHLVTVSSEVPREFDDQSWEVPRCSLELCEALRPQDSDGVMACMRTMDRLHCWRESFEQILAAGDVSGSSVLWFWVSFGPHISDALKGDPILATVLKALLPPYAGPEQTLYRGEATDRHLARTYGMSWTTEIEVARMFAERRDPPGVVLKLAASAGMIIAGPTLHSQYLGEHEYLVDPSAIRGVETIY